MPIVQVSDSNGNNGDTISNKADYFFHAIRLMYCFFVEIETPLVTFNYINYNWTCTIYFLILRLMFNASTIQIITHRKYFYMNALSKIKYIRAIDIAQYLRAITANTFTFSTKYDDISASKNILCRMIRFFLSA